MWCILISPFLFIMKYYYVYRVTSIQENKHYYGYRSSTDSPENDLGVKYFTSSTNLKFKELFKNNPENYKLKIVSVFDTREEAMLLEIKLHNKFNVGVNANFYNKCKATSTGFSTEGIPHTHSDETKEKISKSSKGRVVSQKTKDKLSKANSGKKHTQEHATKISKANKGKKHTQDHRSKLSKAKKGKTITQEHRSNISKAKKGVVHSKESLQKRTATRRERGYNTKIILQHSLEGEFIKKWTSISLASSTLKVDGSNISQCALEKKKSAGGFIWKFF